MIPGEKEFKLIQIYMYICDLYDRELKYESAPKNPKPDFGGLHVTENQGLF
jgi:hypothetical protein